MLIFALYLVALASPVVVFWLVTITTSRKVQAATKEKLAKAARPRRRRVQDIDAEMAVLEAQFIVAPRMAFDEAQEALSKASHDTAVEHTTLINRRSFEDMLQALATSRTHSHHIAS
jgi:hypothetical protein